MREIDARGLACPAPVLQIKAVIEEEPPIEINVVVDNEAARQNVVRFLESQQYGVSAREDGGDFQISGRRMDPVPESSATPASEASSASAASPAAVGDKPEAGQRKIMVMVATNCIGHGDEGLGGKLMASFIKTLKEMTPDLWRLVLVNSGVKLSIDESEVLDDLVDLAKSGVHILVCGTCLTHFDLMERKQVGETTNMLDIVTSMQLADKVINL